MHDALRAYERDVEIVDVEDYSPPRVRTEELTMHVNVLGLWHRRTPDLSATACGVPFNSQFAAVRREELTHPLCGECFTKFEVGKADRKKESP